MATFPNPPAAERDAWTEQYWINQWDALDAIFDQITDTAVNNATLTTIADRLFSNGFSNADWTRAINNAIALSFSAGNNVEVISATGATPTAANDALETAIDTFKAGASLIIIGGISITSSNSTFTEFTAAAVITAF